MADDIVSTITLKLPRRFFQQLQDPDEAAWLEIYNEYARAINPWVPMDEGVLSQSVQVSSDGLTYPGPYAHYQYIGEIYGPNIPIYEDGEIVGWWSPPDKYPTGRPMEHGREKHPLASSRWDEAAMEVIGDQFAAQVASILIRRALENE